MNKMKPEIKSKWLTELRSGKYKQGTDALKRTEDFGDGQTETRYCCLGVLCEIAVAEGVIEAHEPARGDINWGFGDRYEYEGLTEDVQEWAGIDTSLGELCKGYPVDAVNLYSVADLNDKGMTFAEIADIIEKEF